MAIGITLGGRPCLDPNTIREACLKESLPTDWYGKPNRYSCPNGLEPGSGYLLMAKSDYDQLDPAKTHALIFASEYGTVSFPGIMLCGFPRNLYPGAENPPLLVEITDTRCNLLTVTNQRYTWRATPDQEDANNEMTWGEVIEDLWGRLGLTDAFPGLNPFVNGVGLTMEQYDCHGFKVANALEDVLTALGCCLSYNPFFNNYSAAYLPGVVDQSQVFGRLFRNNLIHDDTPYNSARQFNVPNTIRVQFPVWSANPDTSELAVYAKDVAVAASAATYPANRRGAVILQDNQPLRIDADGNLLNQTLIDDRAVAVATAFIDRLKVTAPIIPISQIYRGFLDGTWAKPGEQFDLVVWMETGNGPMTAVFRAGMQGTIPIYQENSLGSDGLKEAAFEYDLLYDQGIAQRVGGVVPTPSRQFQNEGWWYQPTERMQRLFGTGLGPYMFRTQNLRYGDWASDSAGGYGDHRGHLIRPYGNPESSGSSGDTVFFWTSQYEPEVDLDTSQKFWYGSTTSQTSPFPNNWEPRESAYLTGANNEDLQKIRKYLAKKDNAGVVFDGAFGSLPVYTTFCCDGGTNTPQPIDCGPLECQFGAVMYLELTPYPDDPVHPGCVGVPQMTYTIPLIYNRDYVSNNTCLSDPQVWNCCTEGIFYDASYESVNFFLPGIGSPLKVFARHFAENCYFGVGGVNIGELVGLTCSTGYYSYFTGCPTPDSKYIGGTGQMWLLAGSVVTCVYLARLRIA